MKRLAALFALLFLINVGTAKAVSNPVKAVYLYCSSAAYCDQHIDRLAFVGIKWFIIPPVQNQSAAIHDKVQSVGGKVIWNVHPNIQTGPTAFQQFSVINTWYWPASEGFYSIDEPAKNGWASQSALDWTGWISVNGGNDTQLVSHYGCGTAQVNAAMNPYLYAGSSLGNVCYPATDADGNGLEDAGIVWDGYLRTKQLANSVGRGAFAVPKLFSWAQISEECGPSAPACAEDQFPSQIEFRTMVTCARKADMNVIAWYGYDLWKDWITSNPGTYNSRWNTWVNGALVPAYDGNYCL